MRRPFAFAALLFAPLSPLACGARSDLGGLIESDVGYDANADAHHDAGHDAPHDADADADANAEADADADAADVSDGAVPLLTLSVVGLGADRTSKADQGIYPDGFADGYFSATAVGAFDAVILVTVSNGQPAYGQQWDTLVDQDPVPPLGFSFTFGAQTWVLGVWENGQRVSDASCRISLAPGTHVLELVGSDSGWFQSGMTYRLYGRLSGSWYESNVAVWP